MVTYPGRYPGRIQAVSGRKMLCTSAYPGIRGNTLVINTRENISIRIRIWPLTRIPGYVLVEQCFYPDTYPDTPDTGPGERRGGLHARPRKKRKEVNNNECLHPTRVALLVAAAEANAEGAPDATTPQPILQRPKTTRVLQAR
jgi:hypothetical protein